MLSTQSTFFPCSECSLKVEVCVYVYGHVYFFFKREISDHPGINENDAYITLLNLNITKNQTA